MSILFIGPPRSGKTLREVLVREQLPGVGTATATLLEAVAFAANNPAPDLVVVMQYGTDGGELRDACKAAWPLARVLTLSWIDPRKLRTDTYKITAQVDRIVAAYTKTQKPTQKPTE